MSETNDLHALLVRSLPELNDAILELEQVEARIFKAVDRLMTDWIRDNDWSGVSELADGDGRLWLAPKSWAAMDDDHHLFFTSSWTDAVDEDHGYAVSLTGSGNQEFGLTLDSDTVKTRAFKKSFREFLEGSSGVPLDGETFFLPLKVDRETLATAVGDDAIEEALEPLRETLQRLPQLAAQLDKLQAGLKDLSPTAP